MISTLVLSKIVFVKGGFAKCYELKDKATGEIVAGKIVPKSMLTKAHQKEKMAQVKLVNLFIIVLRFSCYLDQEIRLHVFTYYFKVILSLFSGNPTTCIYVLF